MHDAGFVHGDLKPRNFVRHEDDYALINLHASAKIGSPASWKKSSSAYLPPEAISLAGGDARVREDHVTECRCGELFKPVPLVDRVSVINNKLTLKFCNNHPFSKGQDVFLSGFVPERTSLQVVINQRAFCISDCTHDCIEFFVCDEFSIAGCYDCQSVGSVSFGCLGLCGLAHVAHDMWALGVLIFR